MKALMKKENGPGGLDLVDIPEPQPAADEVLIEVAYAGVCGTDLHILEGRWQCKTPVVLGHEFCGRVAAVGSSVTDMEKGDRVVAGNPARTCGVCYHCRVGNPFMCPQRVSVGFMIQGAFTRYICVKRTTVHRIPENVSLEEAALCEPMSAAVRALTERMFLHAGDRVMISGAGPIALLAGAVAKAEGARTLLTGLDSDHVRLDCARKMGNDVVVNVQREDLAAAVAKFTDGKGIDVAVECAGAPASLSACLKSLRKGGTLVQVGIYGGPFEVDFNALVMNELTFIGVYGHVWGTWEKSLALMSDKKVDVRPLITHTLPITKFNDGLAAIHKGEAIKVLLTPA